MEFEALKDLAKTVFQSKVKNIEILGNPNKKKNKTDLFFEFLINGDAKSESETVRYLFKSHDIKYPSYVKLKKKLTKQLIDTSFFVDVDNPIYNDRAKSYFTCYKDFAASIILLSRGSDLSSIFLLEKIFEQSVKYEFIDLAAETSKWLRYQYARSNSDYEKNNHYTKLQRYYEDKRRWEAIAFDYQEDLMSYYIIKRSPNELLYKKACAYLDELMKVASEVDTSSFYKCFYNIAVVKYMSIKDYEAAILICDEALHVLESKKTANRSTIASFNLQKIALFTQIRFLDKGCVEKLFNKCTEFYSKGEYSWFRVCETFIYYLFSVSDFEKALLEYKNSYTSVKTSNLKGSYMENWLLIGGYIHLISNFGLLDASEVEQVVGKFKYSKIYNDIEILKKDKEGMNIPLLLLPVLYELAQAPKDRTKEIPIEALDKYRQRWLANDMNRRSNSFLKILLTLAQSAGTSIVNEKKIKKEWEILKNETPDVAGQSYAIEIIPYETLIELLFAKWGLSGILQPEATP
ncbi:MAG TPA: hypothetical protein PLO67_05090 [Saprospiraceae bacterium]|nr:hypothetical protein [Saprospiraceae bacterium]HPI06666.1 hypothetical protein [Saprospiraceae bacterium]